MSSNLPAQRGQETKAFLFSPNALAHLSGALRDKLRPEVMVQAALSAMLKTPSLIHCSKESILQALLKLSTLGLVPDGRQAALVPFKDSCTAIPMYQGLMQLARGSGAVSSISAAAVYERDDFDYRLGTDPSIEHRPTLDADPGPLVATYAVAKLSNGEVLFRVVPRRDIDKARASSAAARRGDSPWNGWYDEMAIKTAVLRLCKYLPQSVELQGALDLEEASWRPDVTLEAPDAPAQPKTLDDLSGGEMPPQRSPSAHPAGKVPVGARPDGQMECPNLGLVPIEKCSTCASREGCPAWE